MPKVAKILIGIAVVAIIVIILVMTYINTAFISKAEAKNYLAKKINVEEQDIHFETIELEMDKELEIYNLKDIKLKSDIIGIWASLDISDKYPFNSNEKQIIKDVKEVVKSSISNVTLYKYGLYVNQVAADILGIDRTLVSKMYDNLPINSRKSIKITSQTIMDILNKKAGSYFKDIYNDLEEKILNGKLQNDENKLQEYVLEKYS